MIGTESGHYYYITYIIIQWQMVSTSLRSQEGSQSSQHGDCAHDCGHVRDDCYELPLAASDPNQVNRGLDATFLFSVDCSADCGLTQIRTSCGKLLGLTRQIRMILWLCSMTFGVSRCRYSHGTAVGRRGAKAPAARPDSICLPHIASGFYLRALWLCSMGFGVSGLHN